MTTTRYIPAGTPDSLDSWLAEQEADSMENPWGYDPDDERI